MTQRVGLSLVGVIQCVLVRFGALERALARFCVCVCVCVSVRVGALGYELV